MSKLNVKQKREVKHHRNERVSHCISAIYEDLLYKLKQFDKDDSEEIDIFEIIHQSADTEFSKLDNVNANLKLAGDLEKYDELDNGVIDYESHDFRQILSSVAFYSLRDAIEQDSSFMRYLINKLNNERIDYETAQELTKQIEHEDKTADNAYREYEV